jgi:hypothetical protein
VGRTGLVILLVLASGVASAQPSSEAQKAFERGRAALQTGNYQQACVAFSESYDLDPQGETRFNMALCSEQLGKLATALRLYQELAKAETGSRRARSAQAAESLLKRVPRLRIELGNKDKVVPAGFVVTVDGERVTNFKDTPIDIGTHTVMAAASGHENWQGVAEASWEREVVVVSITLVPGTPGPDILTMKPSTPPPRKTHPTPTPIEGSIADPIHTPPPPSHSKRRPIGIGLTIGGGAVIAGGLVVGALAQGKWGDAKKACDGLLCGDSDDFARGQMLVEDARSRGNLATGLVIGGGVLAVTGLVLWFTAPSGTSEEHPITVTPTTNGVAFRGSF